MVDAALLAAALTSGVLSFFSPCGFPMLPAYVAHYLPREGPAGEPVAHGALRGALGGLVAALGALTVLSAIGAAAILIGAPFKERVLLIELVGGLLVLGLGVLTLLGKGPRFKVALQPSQRRGALGLFAFGALYAGVAAGCVAPVFLFVLFSAAAAPTTLDGALQVGAYVVGFAGPLVGITLLVATAQDTLVRAMKRILPHVERLSGWVLVAVGTYLIVYWARVEGYL